MDPNDRDSLMTPTEITTEARLRTLERMTLYIAGAFALAFALMASGCSGTVKIKAPAYASHEVELACEILGIQCESTTKAYGAIKLRIVDEGESCDLDDEHVLGYMDDSGCTPRGCSELDPWTIAHEFGHALDLDHVEDRTNLMYPSRAPNGIKLELPQLETVAAAADRMDVCR